MQTSQNKELIELLEENYNLSNKQVYTQYILSLCKFNYEKVVIKKILSKAMQNNSLIRIRNDLIKKGIVTEHNSEEMEKQEIEVRNQYSPINGLLQGIFRTFK